jgi:dipeptidyl aminopeptidase/acylaminoacyl peptidase
VNGKYYLMKRGNAKQYPNCLLTSDFVNFQQVTNLQPEKYCNWMTAELHLFKRLDSSIAQGLLYKPENFNPIKKYPVIFLCYETMSDDLNKYLIPKHSNGPVEVSYLVSNGYLVFLPDVIFKHPGMTGESFYNAVMGAAQYLERMPYVDGSKMGLEGHSFGAFGINYIITHTNKFAAALSASGASNMVSMNTALWDRTGNSKMNYSQYRLDKTLWEDADLYLKNSPIILAQQIVTPVLLMANKADTQVPNTEGRGLFISLRRLGKPVWMLEYDEEGHTIRNEINQKDYEYRVMEFFDYYLKGKPMPAWLKTI